MFNTLLVEAQEIIFSLDPRIEPDEQPRIVTSTKLRHRLLHIALNVALFQIPIIIRDGENVA
jgi:hypothetical protein